MSMKLEPRNLSNSQRQRDVADPIMNEAAILSDLDRVASTANASQLKSGSKLAIVDAFDRRPDREPFHDLVQEACSLQANLSRLEFAETMRRLFVENKLSKETLDGVVKTLVEKCEEHRTSLVKKFKPVTEMRLKDDKVH